MAETVLERIRKLEAEKAKIIAEAREQALKKAQDAVAELATLGFQFDLVEKGAKRTASARGGSGTRRQGIRDDILATLKGKAHGMKAADVIAALNFDSDEQGKQSVRNALANMTKAGTLKRTGDKRNGTYILASQ